MFDGDTHEAVRHARVAPRGRRAVVARAGVARLDLPSGRISVRVAAPGYAARMVRLDFHKRLAQRVELWRSALQWPNYGVNPARTQVSGINARPPFRVVWKRNLHGLLEFPATVWGGVAYAHTMGAAAGLAMVDAAIVSDGQVTVEVDIADELHEATLSRRPLYDPSGSRMRA